MTQIEDVGKNGEEFRVTPYFNESGYKYDYYDRSPYGNTPHNSTHIKSDLNENWHRTDNDRDNASQSKSSGSGCYLTTACMHHMQEIFDDNCQELMALRWFRDNFVLKKDIKHYYTIAPIIVNLINSQPNSNKIYKWIYENVIVPSIKAIQNKNYELAYSIYKNSILDLEEKFAKPIMQKQFVKVLKKI